MTNRLLCASGGCTQNAKNRHFGAGTDSAASAQSYSENFETFTVTRITPLKQMYAFLS